jgi:hypothetical protein
MTKKKSYKIFGDFVLTPRKDGTALRDKYTNHVIIAKTGLNIDDFKKKKGV